MAVTGTRRRSPVRVQVHRTGDALIIEPQPGDAPVKRPARRLADTDTVVCDLPVRTSTGSLRSTTMKVRLPRHDVEQAMPAAVTGAEDLIQEAGDVHMLNLSSMKRRSGIPAPGIPGWLKAASERLRSQADSSTPMTDIARCVGVHPVHLSRTFARTFGRTMTTRAQEVRVEGACRDLLLTHRSVADIAADHGFADQSHLTRSLRKAIGLTPTQLRRKAFRQTRQ